MDSHSAQLIIAGGITFLAGLGVYAVKALFFDWPVQMVTIDGVTTMQTLPDPTAWLWRFGTVILVIGIALVILGVVMNLRPRR